ncbi:MAG TPA: hypothetical protein VNW06_00485 [Cytophagaceae bacterium]|jgi:hypothetical protein|nr:hypothetical protein [Cytophagaceae bacterium]
MKKINHIITDQNIVLNYDGQTHTLSRLDEFAPKLIEALKEKRFDDIPLLVSAATRIETFSNGRFKVQDGEILVDDIKAPAALSRKIIQFSEEGLPYEPLVEFARKLNKNPSYRAVTELFQFLEKNNHPITDTGNFVAYKKVAPDFKDIYTHTFDNSPGAVCEMPRNQVNEDPTQTCSHGLHVANWDYANYHYGSSTDIVLEVEVDPENVVAVPVDYDQAKMRVSKYKVLGVVDKELSTSLRVTRESEPDDFKSPAESFDDEFLREDEEEELCGECGEYFDQYGECECDYNPEKGFYDEEKKVNDWEEDINVDEKTDEYPWNEELD